jgi:hypothetical protein
MLERAVYEIDGRAAGYALYRIGQEGDGTDWRKTVKVREAFGSDHRATREVWRFLLSIDWMDRLEAWHLPVDHPLKWIVARMNLLEARELDALWVAWSTSAPLSQRAPTPATGGSRSRSATTRSSPTTCRAPAAWLPPGAGGHPDRSRLISTRSGGGESSEGRLFLVRRATRARRSVPRRRFSSVDDQQGSRSAPWQWPASCGRSSPPHT